MNYVVLHIDLEFIAGVVCTGDGNSYPITNGNDELLYLYFYNDPHTNKITFGKSNRDNVYKEATNYYGKFFKIITDGHTSFKRGEFQKEAIELLQYSELLETIKVKYAEVTRENKEDIHTLITFSLSISDLAKQKTVEYLRKQGFTIDSYSIPLAELVGCYPHSKKEFLPENGSTIVLLAATNATLHIMKLVFSNSYFLLDGAIERYEGMGIDPRKRALVGFIINQINLCVGALNQNEFPSEIEKKEFKAEEWLRKIDAKSKNDNSPIVIAESLSPMPSCVRQVLVKKTDIETFTNDFINLLMDHFNAFKNDNISGDIAGVFLIGDCFNNSLVKQRFKNLFRDEDECRKKLFSYANTNIQDILSVYPKIDFRRYINEEERSKAKAEAEKKKIAEQRAIDAKKEAEAKAEQDKIVAEKKLEENRKEAANLYEFAIELNKAGKFQDALINIENAVSLDKENKEYNRLAEVVAKKIKELDDKNENYKSWYKDAESYEQTGELDLAIKAYKNAQQIFDSAELRKKIVKLETYIEKLATETKVNSIITLAIALANKEKFEDAIANVQKALEVDPTNNNAKEALNNILAQQSIIETEKQYKEITDEADKYFKESSYDNAIEKYNKAYSLKNGDKYCHQQIDKIKQILKETKNKEKALKIIEIAEGLFKKDLWIEAKTKYEEVLFICPNDSFVLDRISKINKSLKLKEDEFKDLLSDAIIAETKGTKDKLNEALEILKKALIIKPNNVELKERIKKISYKLNFSDIDGKQTDIVSEIKNGVDEFSFTKKIKSQKDKGGNLHEEYDNFLFEKKNKSKHGKDINTHKEDDFSFVKKTRSEKQNKDFNW